MRNSERVKFMTTILVNPLNETFHQPRPAAPRLHTFSGKTVALLDISKPGGSVFLDRVAEVLTQRFGVKQIIRITKPTFTKPAPDAVMEQILNSHPHAVIEALAD